MSTREKILEVFTRTREDANTSYRSEDLLEHLIVPNGKKLDDSFKGKRYKIRFIRELQTAFTVCFPQDFYDKNWHLDDLTTYIEVCIKNPSANVKMAEKWLVRSKHADMNIMLFGNILLLAPLSAIQGGSFWIYAALPITFNAMMLRFKLREISYHKKLLTAIKAAAA